MAAPPEVTMRDLNGQYIMNKRLSSNIEPILILQGVSWFTRKAIVNGTVTLYVKEYVDASSITHIDIEQVGLAGVRGSTELRSLDWEERQRSDNVFGEILGKSRWIAVRDVEDAYLRDGWGEEMNKEGAMVMESYVKSVGNGWTADQIWGFEEVDGERRYSRHVVVTKGDQRIEARLIYDFQKR